jgi:hypothetical protein
MLLKYEWNLIMLHYIWLNLYKFDLIWLCYIMFEWKLIILLNFHLIWLCYIFSIIRRVINICGVSKWKLYFIVFHLYKVGVGFTSPSEPMCHPFRNDAPHIKLWGASLLNCPAHFRQPENGDQCLLSNYASSCVSFIHGFGSVAPLFSNSPILGVWSENSGVMLPKSWTKDTWELV